ncbi:hypothetical protein VOLCADRAFT_96866 [Volvox carteri f. nagariensis]|uniref:Uncharacterized protein n=1 Tax=Volvox carteri f. nagariensis TaxID=3068 RepID=D8UBI1_VOLCA|nr:uncharacterized protein VOLCADRAFT_96866 [Volvox carteri f. nagariensis]EFJ42951.1 hypothetical protein VOLCADRAFT_96866 [Volvox carteri f. nagariensis]|eukprot:XP_002955991.1 hypothetical protein VOLCADRAFT_96866 [Volvox carteri f. nagariensis]
MIAGSKDAAVSHDDVAASPGAAAAAAAAPSPMASTSARGLDAAEESQPGINSLMYSGRCCAPSNRCVCRQTERPGRTVNSSCGVVGRAGAAALAMTSIVASATRVFCSYLLHLLEFIGTMLPLISIGL